MIPHTMYFKLQAFKAFWEIELSKHPQDRMKPRKHYRNIFDTHSKNMKKIGEHIMPKKEQKKPKFEWKGYVNINIPDAKISAMEKFVSDEKNVFFSYNEMLVQDYQVKQFYDDYTEAIKTVAVCHNHESANFGYAITAFAGDWYTSLAVLIFKHTELADKEWDTASVKTVRKFG